MRRLGIETSYEHLTLWERIWLKLAARHRKDDVEERRLNERIPADRLLMPPHMLTEMTLHTFTLLYVAEQLESAAGHFFAQMLLREGHIKDEGVRYDLAAMAGVHAFCFVAKAKGWRRFCASIGVDADGLVVSNHEGMMLELCEGQMANFVPLPEELLDWFRTKGLEPKSLISADSEYQSWRRLLEQATTDPPCFQEGNDR